MELLDGRLQAMGDIRIAVAGCQVFECDSIRVDIGDSTYVVVPRLLPLPEIFLPRELRYTSQIHGILRAYQDERTVEYEDSIPWATLNYNSEYLDVLQELCTVIVIRLLDQLRSTVIIPRCIYDTEEVADVHHRVLKRRGDISMLLGDTLSAKIYYNSGFEDSEADLVWKGACLEGLASISATLGDSDAALSYIYMALDAYDSFVSLRVECVLRLIVFLFESGNKLDASTWISRVYDMKFRLSAQDQISIGLECARICKSIGFTRKCSLYLREVALIYGEMYQWEMFYRLVLMSSPTYLDTGWGTLHRCVLEELVFSASKLGLDNQCSGYLCQYMQCVSPETQANILNRISTIPSNTRCLLPIDVSCTLVSVEGRSCRGDTSIDNYNPTASVFLVAPASSQTPLPEAPGMDVSVGQVVHYHIVVSNLLSVPQRITHVSLSVPNSYPVYNLLLPPNSSITLQLSCRYTENVSGVNVCMYNMVHEFPVASSSAVNGLAPVPLATLLYNSGSLHLIEGQNTSVSVILSNNSSFPITYTRIYIQEHVRPNTLQSQERYYSNGEPRTNTVFFCSDVVDLLDPGQTVTLTVQVVSAAHWCSGATLYCEYGDNIESYRLVTCEISIRVEAGLVIDTERVVNNHRLIQVRNCTPSIFSLDSKIILPNTVTTVVNPKNLRWQSNGATGILSLPSTASNVVRVLTENIAPCITHTLYTIRSVLHSTTPLLLSLCYSISPSRTCVVAGELSRNITLDSEGEDSLTLYFTTPGVYQLYISYLDVSKVCSIHVS